MKLKTLSAAYIAGALLCPSLTAYAGIPVMVDADPLRQIQYATDAQNWLKTVEQYKSQLNAYKSQLATATGVRNVQDFLSQAKGLSNDLKNLQKNGISLNDLLTNSGGSYSSALNGLYSKYKMFDTCDATQTQSYADTCKQIVINRAVAVEDTTAVQEKINSTVINTRAGYVTTLVFADDEAVISTEVGFIKGWAVTKEAKLAGPVMW
ncbi:type IV secretion system protein [Yersinia enterocolitica]